MRVLKERNRNFEIKNKVIPNNQTIEFYTYHDSYNNELENIKLDDSINCNKYKKLT